jgi:hypothetical protein
MRSALTGTALLLVGASVFCPQAIPAFQAELREIGPDREEQSGASEPRFRLLPKKSPRIETDIASLRNGDKLSGIVERISGESLFFRSELLPGTVAIPLGNVRQILFQDKESSSLKRSASAFFVNGEHVGLDVKGYDESILLGETSFGKEVSIRREDLSGIVFERPASLLCSAELKEGHWGTITSAGGEWRAEGIGVKGQEGGAEDPGPLGNPSYLRFRQKGHLRYEWVIRTKEGSPMEASLLFFARSPDVHAPGAAHQVRILGRDIHVYTTIQNSSQYVGKYSLPANRDSVSLILDYDAESGMFRLKADEEEMIAGVFSPPAVEGEYIIIAGRMKDRSDRLTVWKVADSELPGAEEAAATEDCVFLMSGDHLSGEILLIAEEKMNVRSAYHSDPLELQLKEVISLVFRGGTFRDEGALPRIGFRNGDRLGGEVIRLEGDRLEIRSPYLGDLEIDAGEIASITFGPGGGVH